MIERRDQDDVAILRIEHGKANAFDPEFCDEIGEALAGLGEDVRALVLTGTGSIFSAGLDLRRLLEEDEAYVDELVPRFDAMLRRILSLPIPVVASMNGHAIAGGCILAAACDHRLMVDDESLRIGVTELAVGVPFPVLALETMREVVAGPRLWNLVLSARTLNPREALDIGLVDDLVPRETILSSAHAAAQRLGSVPLATFAATKRQLRQPLFDRVGRYSEGMDPDIRTIWKSERARDAIREFVGDRIGGPKSGG